MVEAYVNRFRPLIEQQETYNKALQVNTWIPSEETYEEDESNVEFYKVQEPEPEEEEPMYVIGLQINEVPLKLTCEPKMDLGGWEVEPRLDKEIRVPDIIRSDDIEMLEYKLDCT